MYNSAMLFNDAFREKAAEFLNDLGYQYHSVVLIPAPEPGHAEHKMRVAENSNPAWYRRMCEENQSIRGIGRKRYKRPRTIIKRGHVIRTLERIIETGQSDTVHAERIYREIEREFYKAEQAARALEPWTDPETGKTSVFMPF